MENKTGKPMLTKKGPIWDTTGGTAPLEATIQYTNRMGLQVE